MLRARNADHDSKMYVCLKFLREILNMHSITLLYDSMHNELLLKMIECTRWHHDDFFSNSSITSFSTHFTWNVNKNIGPNKMLYSRDILSMATYSFIKIQPVTKIRDHKH